MVASGKRVLWHGVNENQTLTLRPVSGTNERLGREEASGAIHGGCFTSWDVNQAGGIRGPLGTRVLRVGRGQDYAIECGALAKRRKDAVDCGPQLQKPLQRPHGTSLFGLGTMHETDCFGW